MRLLLNTQRKAATQITSNWCQVITVQGCWVMQESSSHLWNAANFYLKPIVGWKSLSCCFYSDLLGIVPSLGYRAAAFSPCRTQCARPTCPSSCTLRRSEVQQHASVKRPSGCETCQACLLCTSPSIILFTVWWTPWSQTNAFSMCKFESTASISTYRIFPYVMKPSHLNIFHFKVFTCFNPELFDSTQASYPLSFYHWKPLRQHCAVELFKSPA